MAPGHMDALLLYIFLITYFLNITFTYIRLKNEAINPPCLLNLKFELVTLQFGSYFTDHVTFISFESASRADYTVIYKTLIGESVEKLWSCS